MNNLVGAKGSLWTEEQRYGDVIIAEPTKGSWDEIR